jgi:hypothetical protein
MRIVGCWLGLIRLVRQKYILKLKISVYDFEVVTVVNCGEQLQHDLLGLCLGHHMVWLALPVLIELTTRQILHDHDDLVLLGKRKGAVHFHNMPVLQFF